MKKILVSALLCVSALSLCAQDNRTFEPEFIGETNLLCINQNDTVSMPAEKSVGRIKSKAGASVYLFEMGAIKTRIHVEGKNAGCIAPESEQYRLVVKAANNDQDPVSFIRLVRFEIKKKERRCEIAKVSTFGGSSEGVEQQVMYNAKRYGKSSYLLSADLAPGEYGVIISNPERKDEKQLMVYCFSIPGPQL